MPVLNEKLLMECASMLEKYAEQISAEGCPLFSGEDMKAVGEVYFPETCSDGCFAGSGVIFHSTSSK